MAKKTKKKRHPIKNFFSILVIFIAFFLISAASSDLLVTLKLKKEISSSEEMISTLESQKSTLSKEKSNLEDPAYVKRFARGKFLVCKPEEQVFKLPSKNEKAPDEE